MHSSTVKTRTLWHLSSKDSFHAENRCSNDLSSAGLRPAVAVWAMADEFASQEAQEGRDLDPLAKRQVRRMIWRDTRRAIARHGDPTPKINPLDPPRATDRCSERSVS